MQVLASIQGNGLEGYIDGSITAPYTDQRTPNSEFVIWKRTDQQLLGWLLSSMTESVLGIVLGCKTSFEVWKTLEKLSGSQNKTRALQLKNQMMMTKKNDLSVYDYFHKMKGIADSMAAAGAPMSDYDFMISVLGGIGSDFNPVAVLITGRGLDLDLSESLSMLMTHEGMLEQQALAETMDANLAFAANFVQKGNNNKKGFGTYNSKSGFNQDVSRSENSGYMMQGNFKGNQGGNFYRGRRGGRGNNMHGGRSWNQGHTAATCKDRFNKDFIPARYPHQNNYNQGFNQGYSQRNMSAYLATPETVMDDGWYLDSGATHHLTNDLNNLNISEPYEGNEKLIIGNGYGLTISRIGNTHLAVGNHKLLLKNLLFVPHITKNLLSISKLTSDNSLIIEFCGNTCFLKDKKKRTVLLEGVAMKGLYKLKLEPGNKIHQVLFSTVNKESCSDDAPMSMVSHCSDDLQSCSSANTPAKIAQNCLLTHSSPVSSTSINILHRQLGHPSSTVMKHVLTDCKHLQFSNKTQLPDFCDACQYGKVHKLHFKTTATKTASPLELIHTDLWGPAPITSLNGYKYYISFIDDYSRYTWIYPLKTKSQALSVFIIFQTQVEKQFGTAIKSLQSDWGGEFRSFVPHLQKHGILFRHPCPHTHHQNGRVERKHRHLVEMGLTLLAQAKLPLSFWWEAFSTSAFLINQLPTSVLSSHQSPHEVLHKHKPDYAFLKCFGCSCFPYLRFYNKHKFNYHTTKCLFIGYSPDHKGYKCLSSKGVVYVARHVVFNESEFPFSTDPLFSKQNSSSVSEYRHPMFKVSSVSVPLPDSSGSSDTFIQQLQMPAASASSSSSSSQPIHNSSPDQALQILHPNHNPSSNQHIQLPHPHHNPSHPHALQPTHPMLTRAKAGVFKPKFLAYSSVLGEPEPATVSQALSDSKWKAAMQAEYDALMDNKTWILVPASQATKIVGCKWVFRIKYNADGSVSKYKARLVAKGFHQTPGIDYFETFSPVVKQSTVRIILSLAVMKGWKIRQIDINNAFLNGELNEDVYMFQPEGFVQSPSGHVCKLHKALYGLKQAPRAWFDRLRKALLQWGFQNSKADSSLFIKHESGGIVVVLVYVDDILITRDKNTIIETFIRYLGDTFALKDLGEFSYFLGIEVTHAAKGSLHLSQAKYVRDLLTRTDMKNCRESDTPMSTGQKLRRAGNDDNLVVNVTEYRSIIGALQYLVLTRPELAFSVNKLSQFLAAPTEKHWIACKKILRYLKATEDYGLLFKAGDEMRITAYTDADWACDVDDRKSVGAYCVYLGQNLISWSSKKQQTVARSSTESEYRALSTACAEIVWIQALLGELKLKCSQIPIIWCDNNGAAALATNPVYHARTKHIELDVHFIREKVTSKQVEIKYVPSEWNIADVLTKPMAYSFFNYYRDKLNVVPRPLSLRRGVEMINQQQQSNG
ncbi:retrovirus-related pol polyprotein from transposon RE1 [Citrus sinensis]|nr:retrovirus-related pol polyprotein from transposon RE1 [Citrus sinensis]